MAKKTKFYFGEVAERLKAHAWKVCLGQLNEGSNPSLSVESCSTSFATKRLS
jgi:hypothetical protein